VKVELSQPTEERSPEFERKRGEASLSNPMLGTIVMEVAGKWKC
jgi:hypothetical protein